MRKIAATAMALVGVGLLMGPASAAGTVSIGGSTRNGDTLTVTGGSR